MSLAANFNKPTQPESHKIVWRESDKDKIIASKYSDESDVMNSRPSPVPFATIFVSKLNAPFSEQTFLGAACATGAQKTVVGISQENYNCCFWISR